MLADNEEIVAPIWYNVNAHIIKGFQKTVSLGPEIILIKIQQLLVNRIIKDYLIKLKTSISENEI